LAPDHDAPLGVGGLGVGCALAALDDLVDEGLVGRGEDVEGGAFGHLFGQQTCRTERERYLLLGLGLVGLAHVFEGKLEICGRGDAKRARGFLAFALAGAIAGTAAAARLVAADDEHQREKRSGVSGLSRA